MSRPAKDLNEASREAVEEQIAEKSAPFTPGPADRIDGLRPPTKAEELLVATT
jgi:hypothetical protein